MALHCRCPHDDTVFEAFVENSNKGPLGQSGNDQRSTERKQRADMRSRGNVLGYLVRLVGLVGLVGSVELLLLVGLIRVV